MLKNKLIAFLTIIFFTFFVTTSYAQEGESYVTSVEEGETVPFDGVLFNNTAAAEILALKDNLKEEFLLLLEEQREKDRAEHEYALKNSQDLLAIIGEENKKLLEVKNHHIDRLENLIIEDEQSLDYVWWGLAGLGVGAVLATGITLIVVASQK